MSVQSRKADDLRYLRVLCGCIFPGWGMQVVRQIMIAQQVV